MLKQHNKVRLAKRNNQWLSISNN